MAGSSGPLRKTRGRLTTRARAKMDKTPKLPEDKPMPKLPGKIGTKAGRRSHTQPSMKKDRYERMNMRQKIKNQK